MLTLFVRSDPIVVELHRCLMNKIVLLLVFPAEQTGNYKNSSQMYGIKWSRCERYYHTAIARHLVQFLITHGVCMHWDSSLVLVIGIGYRLGVSGVLFLCRAPSQTNPYDYSVSNIRLVSNSFVQRRNCFGNCSRDILPRLYNYKKSFTRIMHLVINHLVFSAPFIICHVTFISSHLAYGSVL